MRNYEDRAMDFIKAIFPYIESDMESPWTIRKGVREFNENFNRNVIVRSGSARVALITSDYVVKFDYDHDAVREIGGGENEVRLYEIAEREGFAYLFAKITHIEWEGYDFYIMPRIYWINDDHDSAWRYMTKTEEQWCKAHSLTDLHCGNFGFRNGEICIVDYGFQEALVEECEYESEDWMSYDSTEEEEESQNSYPFN